MPFANSQGLRLLPSVARSRLSFPVAHPAVAQSRDSASLKTARPGGTGSSALRLSTGAAFTVAPCVPEVSRLVRQLSVEPCSFELSLRAIRLYRVRLDEFRASCSTAHSPPALGLSAGSCSYGRRFACRFFHPAPRGLGLAVQLRLLSSVPTTSFHVASSGSCRAHHSQSLRLGTRQKSDSEKFVDPHWGWRTVVPPRAPPAVAGTITQRKPRT
jgi:hypothetical protein